MYLNVRIIELSIREICYFLSCFSTFVRFESKREKDCKQNLIILIFTLKTKMNLQSAVEIKMINVMPKNMLICNLKMNKFAMTSMLFTNINDPQVLFIN